MPLRILFLVLIGSLAQADTLSELKGLLPRLNGAEPIKATVDYQFWNRQGDDKKPVITEGRATTQVEDGPQGLRMTWSRNTLQAATQEAKAKALDPEKKTPTRRALEGLKALEVSDYLNGADELLRTLEQSQLVQERLDTWEGKPAKLLQLKVTPKLGQQERKYIKEMEATAKVWVSSEGLPLAAETEVHMKGRALLVISFEQHQKEAFQFTRAGNRLVVLRHAQESSGSGGGEKGQSKTVMSLSLN